MREPKSSQVHKQREARLVVAALAAIAALLLFLILLIPSPGRSSKVVARQDSGHQSGHPDAGSTAGAPSGSAGEGAGGRAEQPSGPVSGGSAADSKGSPEGESGPNGQNGRRVATSFAARPVPETGKRRLYLVIDDVGNNLFQLRPFLEFPGALTIAVMPQLEYSERAATLAHQAGKEVILHLPMEADNPAENPGPGAIRTDMTDQEMRSILRRDIETVPFLVGVNNHMGSRATADVRTMSVVLEQLKRDGLFFLDSRTTATSVARSVAARFGVQFAEREVFLDNVQTRDAILEQFRSAERIAAERGYAVMIGHVWTDPLAGIIKELYPKLLEQGYVFGALSDLVHAPQVASGGSSAAGGQ